MNSCRYSLAMFVLMASFASSLLGQQTTNQTTAAVPQLVNFSGKAIDANGNVVSGIMGITLSIYKEQYEGAPLWSEMQNVTADAKGNYTVQLGATKSDGLPLELFSTGDARWLGVRVNGGEEQPRVLLLSVPYALKAADAQTLGGLPASAFALASAPNGSSSNVPRTLPKLKSAVSPAVSGTGKTDYIPLWTSNTALGDSVLYQSGMKVGVNTITPAFALDVKGKINASGGFDLAGQTFAFGSYSNFNAFLGFAGNQSTTGQYNTGTGYQALFSNTTGSANTATGEAALFYNTTGVHNTAMGSGALLSNVSGNYNTAVGEAALYSNNTGGSNTAIGQSALFNNTDGGQNTASGYQALLSNSTGVNNTATGYEALQSNNGYDNTATGTLALVKNTSGSSNTGTGYSALDDNTTGCCNTATGASALASNTTGINNSAHGVLALYSNATGAQNTASGYSALDSNINGSANTADGAQALKSLTTGNDNTAVGFQALYSVTSGNDLTCIGYNCTVSASALFNATAIGAHAVVGQSNTLVLGGTGPHAVAVGIGTTTPSNVLTIARGAGHPVSDSWETYSSRRWKTNVKTLPNALAKIERLRGVSYDLKDSGKHEIGVIAEEVGQVVPEVVSYEANGKDASAVDYSRLTALLIEAVKQEQKQIVTQQGQLRQQQRLMAAQQREVARLNRKVGLLEANRLDEAKQPSAVALK
jgi:trimeric autotransporter adhesin